MVRARSEEVSQIQQPIIAQKEAEQRKRWEEERIRQQQEAERLQRQREEAEQLRQQQEIQRRRRQEEAVTTLVTISRKQFLKWAGLGSAGLLTAVVAREILNPLDSFKFETVTVDQKGEIVERDSNKQAKFFKEDLGNSVNLEMVYIPGGKFLMGTEDEEIERLVKKFGWEYFRREKPQHEVTVQPFFMGKFQITQKQWRVIASLPKIERDLEPDPSHFKGNDLPVEKVSWEDAEEFCQRLSKQTGKEYRLPSEAEWEYACRAGTTTSYYFGDTITDNLANYYLTVYDTTAVGIYTPNTFGLYDIFGNVWEWCQDDWHDNYKGSPNDGSAWLSRQGITKVLRGGSWFRIPNLCRSAFRYYNSRNYCSSLIGFRIVCVVHRAT